MRKPIIVTLCGSTRFKQAFIAANFRETMAGKIVLSVAFYAHAEARVYAPTESEKIALDELHKRKIDLSDEILVLDCPLKFCPCCESWGAVVGEGTHCRCPTPNVDRPYVGSSTQSEIAYATARGKRIRYLSEEGEPS